MGISSSLFHILIPFYFSVLLGTEGLSKLQNRDLKGDLASESLGKVSRI